MDLRLLERRIIKATGKDRDLDELIASTLAATDVDQPLPDYTSSVDTCIALIGSILPEWHWHVGHGPRGIVPYASLRKATNPSGDDLRVEANAPTVPLALLHAAVKAMIVEHQHKKGG